MHEQLPWLALAAVATLVNGGVLGYIARREQNATLRFWSFAWLVYAAAVVPMMLLGSPEPHPLWAIGCGFLWVVSALLFLRGTYEFSERRMPRAWHVVAAACAVVAVVLGVGPDGALGMVPLVLFQATGIVATGVLVIRTAPRRTGAWLCGVGLIAFALHLLSAPAATRIPELVPWGFGLAISLEVIAALGMLMLYYEHARDQLLETQRTLEQARRIEALGRISGGVAHDFNNVLTVMQGHLDLIELMNRSEQQVAESLASLRQAVKQAGRLTAQLLAFGRRSVVQPETIDVRQSVENTLSLLEKVIPESVRVEFRCEEESIPASLDRALLEQIVLNLVTNARDAISGQGHISVELSRVEAPKPTLLLRVSDDGSGMDQGVVEQVFEPFFTTKAARGTGLGLASVQGAVSQLGGRIEVHSRVGEGSTFEVLLPRTAGKAPAHPPSAWVEVGALDILVVDDADPVRELTARMIETGGHQVAQARDGVEALEKIRASDYDLVLSDVVMPRMGGLELLDQVSKLKPGLPILLASGYPPDAKLRTDDVLFLGKPFERDSLLRRIASVVAARRRSQAPSARAM